MKSKPFTEWMKREQGIVDPVGLEAVKKRIIGENLSDEEIEKMKVSGEARFKGNAPKVQPQIKTDPDVINTVVAAGNRVPEENKQIQERTKTTPRVATTATRANDFIMGSREENLNYLRNQEYDSNSPGNSIKGRGNTDYRVTSGVDSPEQFPYYTSSHFSKINELIKQYIQEENDGFYYSEFPDVDPDNIPKPPHADLFSKKDETPLDVTDFNSAQSLMSIMDEDPKIASVGKYPYLYPREKQALFDNFPEEDENSTTREAMIKRARGDREIPDEVLDESWESLNRKQKDFFMNTGHGIGGSAKKWQSKEGKMEWGRAMHKIYLQQGGRDGYLSYENSPVMRANNLTADHAIAYSDDKEYWHQLALEEDPSLTGNDLKIKAQELSDDPSNIILTRFGFNKQPKNKRDIRATVKSQRQLSNVRNPQKKEAKNAQGELGKQRSSARHERYMTPLKEELKKLMTPLRPIDIRKMKEIDPSFNAERGDILLSQSDYEEIMENAKIGYDLLDSQRTRSDAPGKVPSLIGRNVLTDVKRALLQNISDKESVNSFAKDYPRSGDGAHDSGFNGIGAFHESRMTTNQMLGFPYQDPLLDYMKDPLAKISLFGGENGKLMARQIAKRLKLAGSHFIAGDIGSGQFIQYLKNNHDAIRQIFNSDDEDNPGLNIPEIDQENLDTQLRSINRTIKNVFRQRAKRFSGEQNDDALNQRIESDKDFDGTQDQMNDLRDLKLFPRPIYRANAISESMDEELSDLHSELKSLLSESPNNTWDEIYKDSILEKREFYNQMELVLY